MPLLAQEPLPEFPSDDVDAQFEEENPNAPSECESEQLPMLIRTTAIVMSNGTMVIEAHITSNEPYLDPLYVQTPSRTSEMTLISTTAGGSSRIYQWTGALPESSYSIICWNPCGDLDLFAIGGGQIGCTSTDLVEVTHPNFLDDLQAWEEQGESRPNLIIFLNSLNYLTDAERWAFFQATAMDCQPIEPSDYGSLIPPTYGTHLSDCDCESVVMLKRVSALKVSQTGDSPVEVETDDYNNGGGTGEFRHDWDDIEGGASKDHLLQIADWRGSRSTDRNFSRGDGVQGRRTSTITLKLFCIAGQGQPGDAICACSKPVEIYYAYVSDMEVTASDRIGKGKKRYGSAVGMDMAYLSLQRGSEDPGILDMSVSGDAREFEINVNPAWGNAIGSLIGNIAAIGLILTDSTVGNAQGVPFATDAGDDIATLINTNRLTFTGSSGTSWVPNDDLNGFEKTRLSSDELLRIQLGSIDYLEVSGRWTYHSRVQVEAGHALSVYLPCSDEFTESGCCSQHGFAYISKQLRKDPASPDAFMNKVREDLILSNFSGNDLNDVAEAGSRVRDNNRPGSDFCNDVIVENLILKSSAWNNVVDAQGRIIMTSDKSFNVSDIDTSTWSDGLYFLHHPNKPSESFVVMNGLAIYKSH